MEKVDSAAGTLVVDVIAAEVTDLYGVEFRLNYDPAVLSILDAQPDQEGSQIEPGTMLPVEQGFVVLNAVDQTAGTVTFAMTLLNPAPAVSGQGSLGRVTFNILQDVPSTINVTQADLVSADLQLSRNNRVSNWPCPQLPLVVSWWISLWARGSGCRRGHGYSQCQLKNSRFTQANRL
jgi:hypothetical protein